VVSLKRPLRTAPAVLGLLALVIMLPGCPLSPDSDKGKDDDTRIPPRNSVNGAIEQYAYIWTEQRLPEYELLLHDDFEFFPQSQDVDDFPWMTGDSWARTEEIGIARNMFDDDFVSQENGNSIDSIEMEIEILSQTDTPDGTVVLTHATAQVLWAENSGAISDVRFEFLVVPDPDEPGLYQLKEQRELPLL